jgi:hypothetical protein
MIDSERGCCGRETVAVSLSPLESQAPNSKENHREDVPSPVIQTAQIHCG